MMDNNKKNVLNTGRQFEIDLLKAFCIILMIICHVFDIMTTAGEGDDLLKRTIYFLGNTSSGLFIFSMGIGIVYTTKGTPAAFAKRGIKLLWQGYLLNFIKNFLPLWILSGFNLSEISDKEDMYSTFSTEILTFAGLVFLLTALIKKLKGNLLVFCAVALVFQVSATVLAGLFDSSSLVVRYLMGLFVYTGSPIISGYPLFLFYIYVVFGMLFGELLKRTANKRVFYLSSAACGAAVCVIASVIYTLIHFDISDYLFTDIYHSHIFPAAIWYISQAFIWMALSYPFALIAKEKERNIVAFLSRNITNIYVIHWLCIVCLAIIILSLTEGASLPPIAGLPLSAVVGMLTIVISWRWTAVSTRRKQRKENG